MATYTYVGLLKQCTCVHVSDPYSSVHIRSEAYSSHLLYVCVCSEYLVPVDFGQKSVFPASQVNQNEL